MKPTILKKIQQELVKNKNLQKKVIKDMLFQDGREDEIADKVRMLKYLEDTELVNNTWARNNLPPAKKLKYAEKVFNGWSDNEALNELGAFDSPIIHTFEDDGKLYHLKFKD